LKKFRLVNVKKLIHKNTLIRKIKHKHKKINGHLKEELKSKKIIIRNNDFMMSKKTYLRQITRFSWFHLKKMHLLQKIKAYNYDYLQFTLFFLLIFLYINYKLSFIGLSLNMNKCAFDLIIYYKLQLLTLIILLSTMSIFINWPEQV